MEDSKRVNTKSTKKNRIIDLRAEKANHWGHIKPLVKAGLSAALKPARFSSVWPLSPNLAPLPPVGNRGPRPTSPCWNPGTSPHFPLLEPGSSQLKSFPPSDGPLPCVTLSTTVGNGSLFLPLSLLSIYRGVSGFFPGNVHIRCPQPPLPRMHDSAEREGEMGAVLMSFVHPHFTSASARGGQAEPAVSHVSGHVYQLSLRTDQRVDF